MLYATPDGSCIEEVIHPLEMANGIGLGPDGRTLYINQAAEASDVWLLELGERDAY